MLVLNFVDPALLLTFFGVGCCIFSFSVAFAPGAAGVGCLFALFFFESICYPVRFIPPYLSQRRASTHSHPSYHPCLLF